MFNTLRKWFAPTTRMTSRKSAPRAHLRLERLEDRATPATFTVTTNADTHDALLGDGLAVDSNGAVSLRSAIEEANALPGADTINIPATVVGPISLTLNSTLQVSSDITINGNHQVVQRPFGPAVPAFTILSVAVPNRQGDTCTINSLSFTNGNDATGGGIMNSERSTSMPW